MVLPRSWPSSPIINHSPPGQKSRIAKYLDHEGSVAEIIICKELRVIRSYWWRKMLAEQKSHAQMWKGMGD